MKLEDITLRETSQSQKDTNCRTPLYEVAETVKLTEAQSTRVLPGLGRGGNRELLFHGHTVVVIQDEKVLGSAVQVCMHN